MIWGVFEEHKITICINFGDAMQGGYAHTALFVEALLRAFIKYTEI